MRATEWWALVVKVKRDSAEWQQVEKASGKAQVVVLGLLGWLCRLLSVWAWGICGVRWFDGVGWR